MRIIFGDINYTYIVLIPKMKNASYLKDFRPISLLNIIYKLFSKILCNRIQKVLPSLIHVSQSASVAGRLITDNTIIAFESFHNLLSRSDMGFRYIELKLDMRKA